MKNISQLGWLFPIYGKIKNVPNHQPDNKPIHFGVTPIFLWKPPDVSKWFTTIATIATSRLLAWSLWNHTFVSDIAVLTKMSAFRSSHFEAMLRVVDPMLKVEVSMGWSGKQIFSSKRREHLLAYLKKQVGSPYTTAISTLNSWLPMLHLSPFAIYSHSRYFSPHK